MCPDFDMPKLAGSTLLCCPLETTLLECELLPWLAMAPGQKALPSTSPVQVRQTCFPICPADLCLPSALPTTTLQGFRPDLSMFPTLYHQRKRMLGDCTSSSLSPLWGSCCLSCLLPSGSSTARRETEQCMRL